MNRKVNKYSFWFVNFFALFNILLLVADFTFPKVETEIFLDKITSRGVDGRKSKKQIIVKFDEFDFYGNIEISRILNRQSNNIYFLQQNKYLMNRAFVKVINYERGTVATVFIGYNCYNPYFIYLLFISLIGYLYLLYNSMRRDFYNLLPYFSIIIGIIFMINVIVQYV